KAAGVRRKNSPTPIARPSAGSHNQRPSHETARNNPIAVASVASAGHNRSQKIERRARSSARLSLRSLPGVGEIRSVPELPCSLKIHLQNESAPVLHSNTH